MAHAHAVEAQIRGTGRSMNCWLMSGLALAAAKSFLMAPRSPSALAKCSGNSALSGLRVRVDSSESSSETSFWSMKERRAFQCLLW